MLQATVVFSNMQLTSFLTGVVTLAVALVKANANPLASAAGTCTLSAGGSDDAPAFLKAAADPSCSTVVIPQSTTLNIASRLNMTGLSNKHIVSLAVTTHVISELRLTLS